MYNQERKNRFISEFTKNIDLAKLAQYTFDATEPFEKKFGKDVCTFSVEEMQEALEAVLPIRNQSKHVRISVLREYARWALCYGIPGAAVSVDKVSVLGLDKLREQTFSGPRSFARYLDNIFRPVSELTKEDIYRGFLWMGYMGIDREDCGKISQKDVNFYDMTISFGGTNYEIYREAAPVFHNLVELKAFFLDHGNYETTLDRFPGTHLLRGIRADFSLATAGAEISKRVSVALKEGAVKATFDFRRYVMCGRFYRVLEMERDGIPPDFSAIVAKEYTAEKYPGRSEQQMRIMRKRAVASYLSDYHRWKMAHGI